MVDLSKLFTPGVEFENSDINISDELRARAIKPVVNHRTIEDVGSCIDNNMAEAMSASRKSRRAALKLFIK